MFTGLLLRLHQFLGKQLSLPGERAGAIKITGRHRVLGLFHKLTDLLDHVLLVSGQFASRHLLQILFRRSQQPIGSVPLLGCLFAGRPAGQLDVRLRGSSLADDDPGRWAVG